MRGIRATLTLIAVFVSFLGVQADCDSHFWFRDSEINAEDLGTGQMEYWIVAFFDGDYDLEAHGDRLGDLADTVVRLRPASGTSLNIRPEHCRAKMGRTARIECRVLEHQLADIAEPIAGVELIIAAQRLVCGDIRTTESVLVPISHARDAEGDAIDLGELLVQRSTIDRHALKPVLELAPIDDDDDDKTDLAVELRIDKTFALRRSKIKDAVWKENLLDVTLEGSVATEDESYFDSIKLDLAASWRRTDLEATSLFRSYKFGVFLRPEATSDVRDLDYVYGARVETLLGIDIPTGNKKLFQPYPVFSIGIEIVDPDKRDVGAVPENYERLTSSVRWHLYLLDSAALKIDGEVRHVLDDTVGIEQWTRRWDVSLLLMRDNRWNPFLTYTRGEEPPTFNFNRKVLIGIGLNSLRQ